MPTSDLKPLIYRVSHPRTVEVGLATELLRNETPLHVISDILGHATTASTMIYAKADVESLRGAALDTEEVHHGE